MDSASFIEEAVLICRPANGSGRNGYYGLGFKTGSVWNCGWVRMGSSGSRVGVGWVYRRNGLGRVGMGHYKLL